MAAADLTRGGADNDPDDPVSPGERRTGPVGRVGESSGNLTRLPGQHLPATP